MAATRPPFRVTKNPNGFHVYWQDPSKPSWELERDAFRFKYEFICCSYGLCTYKEPVRPRELGLPKRKRGSGPEVVVVHRSKLPTNPFTNCGWNLLDVSDQGFVLVSRDVEEQDQERLEELFNKLKRI